ncbi:MAG: succinate dehydrogenase, cytochrome b556 subunit [Micropepsaceae bacterium]
MAEDQGKARPVARPLAPHLQIYRWPITMGTSILHRVTGVGLSAGTLLLAWWLVAVSMGPDAYAEFADLASGWFGRLVLFGFTLALVYHAMNGIRHLFWDAGIGLDLKAANNSGIAVYALSIIATLLIWVAAYQSMGAWQ